MGCLVAKWYKYKEAIKYSGTTTEWGTPRRLDEGETPFCFGKDFLLQEHKIIKFIKDYFESIFHGFHVSFL